MKKWFNDLLCGTDGLRRQRIALLLAGLREQELRRLTPDQRVAVLEKNGLDPYDYISLCC